MNGTSLEHWSTLLEFVAVFTLLAKGIHIFFEFSQTGIDVYILNCDQWHYWREQQQNENCKVWLLRICEIKKCINFY